MPVYPVPHALCVPVHKVDILPLGCCRQSCRHYCAQKNYSSEVLFDQLPYSTNSTVQLSS